MRVLIVQNYDNTGLGQVGAALAEANAELDLRKPYLGEALPADASGHDAMVILGGGQNALADDDCPYFPALLDLSRDFEAKDRAVLGICLGSQLLARAFGGDNKVGAHTEFGWHEVELTDAAKADPVLGVLPPKFPIFQWHDDSFTLPPGSAHLARNAAVEHQAFRVGRAVYGMQFHFEADFPLVAAWNEAFASTIAERQPDWPGRFDEEVARHAAHADAAGQAIARAWVKAI